MHFDAVFFNTAVLNVDDLTKADRVLPFGQDNYRKKSHSMIAHTELIPDTILEALNGHQIQPVIRSPF